MKHEALDSFSSGFIAREEEIYEHLSHFTNHMYGQIPSELPRATADILEEGEALFTTHGEEYVVRRRQIRLTFSRESKQVCVDLLLSLPIGEGPFPVLLAPNLHGNHTTTSDRNVRLPQQLWSPQFMGVPVRPQENQRGARQDRVWVEGIVATGRAVATYYYGDTAPDAPKEFKKGVHALYPEAENFSAVEAWAWTMSRVLDHLETQSDIDASKVSGLGFSRGGKALLRAAAQDNRFAAIIAEASGRGGAAPLKGRIGEKLGDMFRTFPHWFPPSAWAIAKNPRFFENAHRVFLSSISAPTLISAGYADYHTDPLGQRDVVEAVHAIHASNGLPKRMIFSGHAGGHKISPSEWSAYRIFLNMQGC